MRKIELNTERVSALFNEGKTIKEMCVIFGCSSGPIHRILMTCNLRRPQKRRIGLSLRTLRDRFYSKVKKGDGCWEWIGHRRKDGYAQVSVSGSLQLAHRVSWQLSNGTIPNGLWVLHRCDNPPCVNPDHLFIGTRQDNVRDMFNKGRCNRAGIKNGRSKLTEYQVDKIRRLRTQGRTCVELATKFGVSFSQISRISRRDQRL